MKIASRILSVLVLVAISTFYMGCKEKNDDKKTEEQIQFEKLKGVWTIVSANDGGDRTTDFIDETANPVDKMKLTLEGNYAEGGIYNYSLTGPRPNPSPWPANGTWKFGTDKKTEIIRDPGNPNELPEPMTYSVTDTELIMVFIVPGGHQGWPGGRVSSVEGQWTFTFTR